MEPSLIFTSSLTLVVSCLFDNIHPNRCEAVTGSAVGSGQGSWTRMDPLLSLGGQNCLSPPCLIGDIGTRVLIRVHSWVLRQCTVVWATSVIHSFFKDVTVITEGKALHQHRDVHTLVRHQCIIWHAQGVREKWCDRV